ncbi:hypothetical protein SAMN05518847_1011076 [Paenibacillus sp. OV219]|nr:hypothetical protein SAMN05518847_1011076 [Paenibacillus sp. OV219]
MTFLVAVAIGRACNVILGLAVLHFHRLHLRAIRLVLLAGHAASSLHKRLFLLRQAILDCPIGFESNPFI